MSQRVFLIGAFIIDLVLVFTAPRFPLGSPRHDSGIDRFLILITFGLILFIWLFLDLLTTFRYLFSYLVTILLLVTDRHFAYSLTAYMLVVDIIDRFVALEESVNLPQIAGDASNKKEESNLTAAATITTATVNHNKSSSRRLTISKKEGYYRDVANGLEAAKIIPSLFLLVANILLLAWPITKYIGVAVYEVFFVLK